jgi:hypothetical protein
MKNNNKVQLVVVSFNTLIKKIAKLKRIKNSIKIREEIYK